MPDIMDFDADLPIPDSVAPGDTHPDETAGPTAYRFAIIGCGQAGGKIAETFHRQGYRRVIAVNTTKQDLQNVQIPDTAKLELGGVGAGKEPEAGAAALKGREDEVYDLMLRNFGPNVDYILVCFGAGGGTGAGIFNSVVEISRRYLADYGKEPKVGIVAALPRAAEGAKPAANAIGCLKQAVALKPSPFVLVDNDRIEKMYPGVSAKAFFDMANASVVKLLDLFNQLAAKSSSHTAFDKADLGRIMDSGLVALGVQKLVKHDSAADFADAIRTQLKNSVLAPIDVATCRMAGLIFIIHEKIMEALPNEMLEHGYERIKQLLVPGATVYRGVYTGNTNDVRVLAAVGGADLPVERIKQLGKLSGADLTGLV